jgi:hypothetical protein
MCGTSEKSRRQTYRRQQGMDVDLRSLLQRQSKRERIWRVSTWATVERIAKRLPEVEASTWFNTPSFKVRGKSFVRLREDDVIVVMVDEEEKDILLAAETDIFFTTPHYDGYPAMLVRLSKIKADELAEVLTESWRRKAPKRLIKSFDARDGKLHERSTT